VSTRPFSARAASLRSRYSLILETMPGPIPSTYNILGTSPPVSKERNTFNTSFPEHMGWSSCNTAYIAFANALALKTFGGALLSSSNLSRGAYSE